MGFACRGLSGHGPGWSRRLGRWIWVVAALAGLGAGAAGAAPVVLEPQFAGTFATGTGADASFVRVDGQWRGSTVLWSEDLRQFGNGPPVGSFATIGSHAWGTGIWGRADWEQLQIKAQTPGDVDVVQRLSGQTAAINYSNSRYNECYRGTWGAASLVPMFTPSGPLGGCGAPIDAGPPDPERGDPAHENWTAHFHGFIRIADPGVYNFSVLFDDGFFFNLIGAGGQVLGIEQDFLNPRNRVGFGQDLQLSEGLYGFELGSWNRLAAGVVDLRWARGGGDQPDWTLVPVENLMPANAVPEPVTVWLLAAAAAGAVRLRRRAVASTPA